MEETNVVGSDNMLLYDRDNHIQSQVLRGEEIESMHFVSLDSRPDMWKLTPTIEEYVHRTGLQHLACLQKVKIDVSLMNALIERWRPETNTFHFGSGESTITLEDVSYLYGLPIDGKAVTGYVWSTRVKLEETVERMLGLKVEAAAYMRGGQLSVPWIQKKMCQLPVNPTTVDEIRYARAYLFCLVASQLSTNNAGARGHAYLLELFEHFERYAWGPACLACVYRSLTRATRIKDRLRTITGPIQLIQIWAYSHTAVGRPVRMDFDATCFNFPLFKMWQTALSTHPCASELHTIRQLLDTDDSNQDFVWQPYATCLLHLERYVEHRDRRLFRCATPLIYYWIVERHNVDRVYKQFGLLQPVPPPLHRWERFDERASKDSVDYGERCRKFVDAWEARDLIVMIKGSDDVGRSHNKEYLDWYRQATGRTWSTHDSVPRSRVESALTKVDLFLQFAAGSIVLMNRDQGADDLYERAWKIGRKIQEFREALKSLTSLEEFNLQGCINEQGSSEDHTGSSSSEWSVEEVLKTAFSHKIDKKERVESTINRQPPTRMVRQRTRPSGTAASSLQARSPCKSATGDDRATEVRKDGSKGGVNLPPFGSPYPSTPVPGAAQPNREYQLSKKERSLLDKFWTEYHTAPDGILETCTHISAQDLYMVLRRHWISTTIMDFWLSISAGRLEGVHEFPATLANMRDREWNSACSNVFNFCTNRRMEDFDVLFFPIWHQSHFFLVVAYPRLKRWDYYNTMGWRKRQWVYALEFKDYVCNEFKLRAWTATNWDMQKVDSCPQQENSDDCGVFVMAIADHLARRRAMGFTQADMWYFRQKIVHDIYLHQLDGTVGHEGSPNRST